MRRESCAIRLAEALYVWFDDGSVHRRVRFACLFHRVCSVCCLFNARTRRASNAKAAMAARVVVRGWACFCRGHRRSGEAGQFASFPISAQWGRIFAPEGRLKIARRFQRRVKWHTERVPEGRLKVLTHTLPAAPLGAEVHSRAPKENAQPKARR